MALLKSVVIWIALLSFTKACREIKLLTVDENDKGALLSLVEERDSVVSNTATQLQLNDSLSPECGSHYKHCQDLLVLADDRITSGNKIRSLVFLPLNKALAIVEVEREEYAGNVRFGQVVVLLPSEVHCSPSAVIEISGAIFAICTNQSTNDVYVLDIILKKSALNQTRYTYSNVLHLTQGSLANRTNFLQINTLGYYFIVFGLGHAIYSIRPLFFIESRLNDVPSEYCDALSWLSPKDGREFWAYCSSNVISYDIGAEDWREAFTLEERGISFWCSQQRINVSVFSSYINVTHPDGRMDSIRKEGQNFKSGVCTGNKEKSIFVYVDGATGIHSLDLNTFEKKSISTGSCGDSYGCRSPFIIDEKYLIVRILPETVLVLDSVNVSQRIMDLKGISAPLVTLLSFTCPPQSPDVPKDIGLQESPGSSSSIVGLTVGLAVPVIFALIIAAVIIVIIAVWKLKKYMNRYSVNSEPPRPEKAFKIEQDDGVFPDTIKVHSVSQPKFGENDPSEEDPAAAAQHSFSILEKEDQEEPPSAESSQSNLEQSPLIKSVGETATSPL